jgi:hypothetical protein
MRARPRGRAVAAVLPTIAIALLVAAAVCGAGFGLQRLVLVQPSRAELLAANSVGVLIGYRYITSEIHVAGEPVRRAACLQGWVQSRKGRPAGRGARISFSDGERLILGDRMLIRLHPAARPTRLPLIAEVDLAGCTRLITDRLYAGLVGGREPRAQAATFDGAPALRMHDRTLSIRLDLYVHRDTFKPLGIRVDAGGAVGWSRLRAVPLTLAIKQRFEERFGG